MWSRSRTRAFVAFVVALALSSAGCLNPHLTPFSPYPPYGYPPPYAYPPPDKSYPNPVDNRTADSVTRAQYQAPPATPPQSVPLPQPNPLPIPVPPNTQPPAPQVTPGAQPGGPTPPPGGATGANSPHQLQKPPGVGEKVGLGPNELPLDRTLEIIRRLDDLIDENKRLQARIRTLEANGLSREQAMNETLREVEKAAEEVVKARSDIQGLRTELTALREKVRQVENDELDTLRKVILALEKVLDDK